MGPFSDSAVLKSLRAGLQLFHGEHPDAAPERIVVIAPGGAGVIAEAVATRFPAAHVQLLTTRSLGRRALQRIPQRVEVERCTSIDEQRLSIVGNPAPDLLVDMGLGPGAPSARRLRVLLYTLADGGSYLACRAGSPDGSSTQPFAVELKRLTALGGCASSIDRSLDLRCGRVVAGVARAGRAVLVEKAVRHFAKLGEPETTSVLTRRYGAAWGEEIEVRPAHTLRSKVKVKVNLEAVEGWFPDELDVPSMYLREYRNVVCAPRQLVVSGAFVVPASFHHPSLLRRKNRSIRNVSRHFAEIDVDLDRAPRLPGTYFHLDSEFPGHFGHLFSEDVAKLWGWEIAKRRNPQLRILRSSAKGADGRVEPFVIEALEAYGIRQSDIVLFHRPVRVQRLITASQQFHNRTVLYAGEELPAVWDRLREGLRSRRAPQPEKIFVSRPDTQRRCLNAARLEATFAAHGFQIVRPELLPLAEQVEMFATARVIGGYAGSAMINMIHSERPGTRIVVASDSYPARNEFLIATVKGDDLHFFSCPSRPPPQPLHGLVTMHYDFEFDFERDGDALERLLIAA